METDVITNIPSLDFSDSTESSTNNYWKYLIIFLILAFLGFNLFTVIGDFSMLLSKIITFILNIFKPILAYFGYGITETVKKTVDLTATGTKKAIDVTSGTLTGGINVLEKGLSSPAKNKKSDIDSVLNKAKQRQPIPDDAGSNTQSSKTKQKAGFCYIGEDRGFRSCISVGAADTCMSGDIFPTRELCINPNLRSG